jgi:hypothetical protein
MIRSRQLFGIQLKRKQVLNMVWSELYDKTNEPQKEQVQNFVDTPLWDDLAAHLEQSYNVKPKLSYSGCSMEGGAWKGWNVKYKKGGKVLCSLYPKQGYFLVLVPYEGKSNAFEVNDENVLRDVKNLIELRVNSQKK